jgi:hypothetical protein
MCAFYWRKRKIEVLQHLGDKSEDDEKEKSGKRRRKRGK